MPSLEATYRSSARRAFAAVWLFRAVTAVGVLYGAAALWRLSLPNELELAESTASVGPRWLVLSTVTLALMSLVSVVTRLGALIAFIAWLYRVAKNLPALGVADAGVTPGWAIGCWFVPFVNIVAPCIVVLRVWRASDPTVRRSQDVQGWPLLYAWWGTFLALGVAGFATWLARGPTGLLTRGQVWAFLCSAAATIVMSLLAVRVVREIERRQAEKSRLAAFT